MFFEVLSPPYHSPIAIESLTYSVGVVLVQTRVIRIRGRSSIPSRACCGKPGVDKNIERVAKRLATDHSSRTDDDHPLLGHGHANARSSTQSTYNRRSENSHAPSAFTNVSL